MKKLILTLTLVVASFALWAQKPNYDLAEQFSAKRIDNMVFSTDVVPNWFEKCDKFWYEWKTSEGTAYYVVDPVAKTKKPVFNNERLAMQLTEIVKDPFDAQHLPLKKLKLKDDNIFTFEVTSSVKEAKKDESGEKKGPARKENKVFSFEYNLSTGELKDVTEQEKEKDFPRWATIAPDASVAVFTKNHNLWWMTWDDMQKLMKDEKDSTVVEHQITFDGIKDFQYGGNEYRGNGDEDTLRRSPANITWSPDSKHFATVKRDMRDVQELWVINSVAKPRPKLETYKYQMPGEPGPQSTLYIFDTATWTGHQVNTAAYKDQSIEVMDAPRKNSDRYQKYFKRVWLGDNESFYLRRKSRDLKRMDVCKVGVDADSVTVMVEEKMNTYVEERDLELIGGGKEMLEWSERNGWANIYLYGNHNDVKKNINDAAYHVSQILHVDEATRTVLFTATGVDKNENPYYNHVYKISLNGGTPQRLDQPDYNNTPSVSDDGKFFVSNYSRVDRVPGSALYDNTGRKIMDLETADFSLLMASGYKFPEQFKVKAADGVTDLWGVMYKPFDFDSTRTYPIIDYVYPGPQVEGNNINWRKGFTRIDRLAQIGFIVITVGNRGGHPDRSKWYHNYGYGNLRDYGLEDQKYAIQQLAQRNSFIDINRVGIHGHSGGGFMSTAAILKYPQFFKVAVSCAGNHDNSMYNRWWSEQHHGIQEEVSEKGDTTFNYRIDKNQDIAGNLEGHLMLVHGDIDNNVHPGNSIRVVDALIRANKRFDLLILPGQRHGFGDMNEYFFWRMADYFSEWLLGSSERDKVDIRQMNND